MTPADTVAALAALASRAHAQQTRRERRAEEWTSKGRGFAEGAHQLAGPDARTRWYLWSGYCGWIAQRHVCVHRAAVCRAMGFLAQASDNVAKARRCMREARKARRLAEGVVA